MYCSFFFLHCRWFRISSKHVKFLTRSEISFKTKMVLTWITPIVFIKDYYHILSRFNPAWFFLVVHVDDRVCTFKLCFSSYAFQGQSHNAYLHIDSNLLTPVTKDYLHRYNFSRLIFSHLTDQKSKMDDMLNRLIFSSYLNLLTNSVNKILWYFKSCPPLLNFRIEKKLFSFFTLK